MDHNGIDVHKRESQIYILAQGGEVIEQRIRTEAERFAAVRGTWPRARILMEASTDSEWVAGRLEASATRSSSPTRTSRMYATRSRKVKTDRRDARALAEACLLGAYRPAHRLCDPQRHVRAGCWFGTPPSEHARDISVIRALLRQQGYRVPSGSAENFIQRVQRLPLPRALGRGAAARPHASPQPAARVLSAAQVSAKCCLAAVARPSRRWRPHPSHPSCAGEYPSPLTSANTRLTEPRGSVPSHRPAGNGIDRKSRGRDRVPT
jgi:hypothetical protein